LTTESISNFIRDHRASFDDLKAPDRVWARINKQDRPVQSFWKWTAIAASALLLIAVGYVFGIRTQAQPEIAGWDEYKEAEQYYQDRIARKMEKIKTLPVGQEVVTYIKVLYELY